MTGEADRDGEIDETPIHTHESPDFSQIMPETESTTESGPETADERPSQQFPEPGSTPVVAGTVDREHALFVVLGALTTVIVVARTMGIGF